MRSERNANQIDNPNNPEIVTFPVDIKHPVVIAFAKAMDDVLTDNDHKGGWGDCAIGYLQARLVEEMGEYFRSVAISTDYRGSYGKAKPINLKELIDIANFAMMLWDRESSDHHP